MTTIDEMGLGTMGDLNELVERLQAGLVLVGESNSDEGTIELFDTDEATATMAEAAAALTSLIAERDDLAETAAKYRVVCNDRDSWRNACLEARTGCNQRSDVIRSLRRHLTAAEAQLKAARAMIEECAKALDLAGHPAAATIARTALSLDTNKGDGE